MKAEINKIRGRVYENNPLIHSITNPISINQCANAVLAVGARPMMAEHPKEAEEITKSANALMLNLGNITDSRISSIMISAKTAEENNIPYILDLVGIACSSHRREFCNSIMEQYTPSVIKGNYSEINALFNSAYKSAGVDADASLTLDSIKKASVSLAKKYNTVVLASGKTDIITDGKRMVFVKNGSPFLSKVTGTGCMLGALCACYLTESDAYTAAICACAVLGICGEMAETKKGNGSFMVSLMDNLSILSGENLEKKLKLEETEIENI